MATWFDEARLDDERVLARPRPARCGRSRRAARGSAASPTTPRPHRRGDRPRPGRRPAPRGHRRRPGLAAAARGARAVVPGALRRLARPGLPGWAGSLDLVVMLAPEGSDTGSASAVAEAVRRGCQVVVACPPTSLVAEHAAGRYTTVLPTVTGDQLATAVVMLDYLAQVRLGPRADAESVATALDDVRPGVLALPRPRGQPGQDARDRPGRHQPRSCGAGRCSPPAPRVAWPSPSAAPRGRTALAGDAEHLCRCSRRPGRATSSRTRSPTPVTRPPTAPLLVLDDGTEDQVVREQRGRLRRRPRAAAYASRRSDHRGDDRGRALRLPAAQGTYAAEYLRIGLVED